MAGVGWDEEFWTVFAFFEVLPSSLLSLPTLLLAPIFWFSRLVFPSPYVENVALSMTCLLYTSDAADE